MKNQDNLKNRKQPKKVFLQESSSKHKFSKVNGLARGAGFEPARPNGPQA